MSPLTLTTRPGTTVQLQDGDFAGPASGLRGDVLAADSFLYDESRAVWNAMIDRRPCLIAHGAYGANQERLARIKERYDPGSLFQVNQNIRPAAAV